MIGSVQWRRLTSPSNSTLPPCFVLLGSDSSTVEIRISSELQDYDDVDADGESLETSVRR